MERNASISASMCARRLTCSAFGGILRGHHGFLLRRRGPSGWPASRHSDFSRLPEFVAPLDPDPVGEGACRHPPGDVHRGEDRFAHRIGKGRRNQAARSGPCRSPAAASWCGRPQRKPPLRCDSRSHRRRPAPPDHPPPRWRRRPFLATVEIMGSAVTPPVCGLKIFSPMSDHSRSAGFGPFQRRRDVLGRHPLPNDLEVVGDAGRRFFRAFRRFPGWCPPRGRPASAGVPHSIPACAERA